jgi:hypothetical protein
MKELLTCIVTDIISFYSSQSTESPDLILKIHKMERRTGTPIIDGGIVNPSPSTTATQDFAQPTNHAASGVGVATP